MPKGRECILAKAKIGKLTPQQAQRLLDALNKEEAGLLPALGPQSAEFEARKQVLENMVNDFARRKRRSLMQAKMQLSKVQQLTIAEKQTGISRAKLLRGVVDSTGLPVDDRALGFRGAQQERRIVRASAHRIMADVLERFHTGVFTQGRNKAQLTNVLRELWSQETGDKAAKEMAAAWNEAAEYLRKSFNAAGGHIAKLEGWYAPQMHNQRLVRAVSYQEWRDFILPKLDRARMLDYDTGQPLRDDKMELVLRDVYETVRTEGFDEVTPSGRPQGSPIATRRAEHRVLQFATADDWLAYQERFGEGDLFGAMMHHIDGMARDIGAMRALGPNPQATVNFLEQWAKKQARVAGEGEIGAIDSAAERLHTVYNHFIGSANAPVSYKAARYFQSARNLLTAAQLGSAVISAITDIGFTHVTAHYNGLPHWKIMARQLKLLNPASAEDRKLAVRLNLIAEEWSQVANAQMRYMGETIDTGWTRRLAEGVLRASGLSAWTQAGRWAFGMEFMGTLADHVDIGFGKLPEPLARTMQRYGIDEVAWDRIRSSELYSHKGAKFLRPDDVGDEELKSRLLDMIQSETEFAIPSTSVFGAAAIVGDARPGTVAGEMMRSALMYKNFAVTLFNTHLMRIARTSGGFNKAKYAARLLISTTLMGALALQLKAIVNGKDPQPMADDNFVVSPKFLLASMAQGGGLGIFGDYAFNDLSRGGQTLPMSLAGPVAGAGGDVLEATVGNLQKIPQDKENFGRSAAKLLGKYTPGLSSLWYARLAYSRLLVDQLQSVTDPDAADSFKQKRVTASQFGQDFFAPPGSGTIWQRPPDFANVTRTLDEGKVVAKMRRDAAKKGETDIDVPQELPASIDDMKRQNRLQKLNESFRRKETGNKRRREKKLDPKAVGPVPPLVVPGG